MNDRELLELAAKAMGFVQHHSYREKLNSLLWISESGFPATWSPLTDDGDALRLAVKLSLFWEQMELFDMFFEAEEKTDKLAATRRAIVRAAAEIGRSMKDD